MTEDEDNTKQGDGAKVEGPFCSENGSTAKDQLLRVMAGTTRASPYGGSALCGDPAAR